jgi:hypothetical protein
MNVIVNHANEGCEMNMMYSFYIYNSERITLILQLQL